MRTVSVLVFDDGEPLVIGVFSGDSGFDQPVMDAIVEFSDQDVTLLLKQTDGWDRVVQFFEGEQIQGVCFKLEAFDLVER